MAVMLIADAATFSIEHVRGKRFWRYSIDRVLTPTSIDPVAEPT